MGGYSAGVVEPLGIARLAMFLFPNHLLPLSTMEEIPRPASYWSACGGWRYPLLLTQATWSRLPMGLTRRRY